MKETKRVLVLLLNIYTKCLKVLSNHITMLKCSVIVSNRHSGNYSAKKLELTLTNGIAIAGGEDINIIFVMSHILRSESESHCHGVEL